MGLLISGKSVRWPAIFFTINRTWNILVPKPVLCDEDPAAYQARYGAIWISCKMTCEILIQRLDHTINLNTLLSSPSLLSSSSNFSLLIFSWETFTNTGTCNQEE
jgi:hypothetical protein